MMMMSFVISAKPTWEKFDDERSATKAASSEPQKYDDYDGYLLPQFVPQPSNKYGK